MTAVIYLHLGTIIPVLLMGPAILLRKKGDRLHKITGRVWAIMMLVSCALSFGIRHNGQLSWLHGLSAWTMFSMVGAVWHIRRGNVRKHQSYMVGSYVGTVIAFIFALSPSRIAGAWVRSLFW